MRDRIVPFLLIGLVLGMMLLAVANEVVARWR